MSEIERYDCEEDRSCEYEVKAVMQVDSNGYYVRHADHLVYLNEMRMDRDVERLRADKAEAESRILRHSNASFLETVAKVCDLLGINLDDAKHADGQPSDVLFGHAKNQAEKLAAAEQRIAQLSAQNQQLKRLLRDSKANLNPSGRLAKAIDAALNPNPEAESHVDCGSCRNITDGCKGKCQRSEEWSKP